MRKRNPPARERPARPPSEIAAELPVARVMVDVPLSHLDHPFDYLVPADLSGSVSVGSRVRVRFSGRLVDAYVLERLPVSAHGGRLARIERVVGSDPVLTTETTQLFRAVADRWGGSFVDVVRLGVPPRHARAETRPTRPPADEPAKRAGEPAKRADEPAKRADEPAKPGAVESAGLARPDHAGWNRYNAGAAFLDAVEIGRPARAAWSALPAEDWPLRIAEAMHAALAAGRGALAVVPDVRDLTRLDQALGSLLGPPGTSAESRHTATGAEPRYVALSADLGPAERYRRWLAVRRGEVRAVIGTRAAAFAPVQQLGFMAMWDDGDDLHNEPRAPYPTVRDVLALRSSLEGTALLLGGYARTAEVAQLVESGWAHQIAAPRDAVRAAAPRITVSGGDVEQERDPAASAARLPSIALRTARAALAAGHPVLVQVPRAGYAPSLACARDRTPARCPVCSGPLASSERGGRPACAWCGRPAAAWACPVCGGRQLRAQVTGSLRTAEELGRAFPGTTVRTSGGDSVLAEVSAAPAVIVATPGAEPVAEGGYGAALLLDGWALLGRPDLRAGEETLRRWMNAAALVRSDGEVTVVADAGVPVVQALVRWDPAGQAARELADRAELGFPPATRMAAVRGSAPAVAELLELAQLPASTEQIGPIAMGEQERLLLRVPRADGAALAHALHAATSARSARKAPDPVRVELDPAELG